MCARAGQVLRSGPAGLITDIDGTISPIAPSPEEARVLPGCRKGLSRLARVLDLVAVLSGRSLESARAMVGLDDLVYVGNHGLEWWDASAGLRDTGVEPYRVALNGTLTFLERELAGVDGIRFEDKGFGLSIHYRASPEPAEARQAILAALDRAPLGDLSILEGKRLVELRPPLAGNKGSAVGALVQEYGLAGVVYLGDDVSDLEALTAVRRLREGSETQSLAVAVRGPETLDDVAATADVSLEGPKEVETFLTWLADELLEEAS